MFHLIDIMPTLCDVAGAQYLPTFQGRQITPAPGISMFPYWQGNMSRPPVRTLYWQHTEHAAIRQGNWKLVTANDRNPSAWELYDMTDDPSEIDNVIQQHPKTAQLLKQQWHQWAAQTNVLPYPESRGGSTRNRPPAAQAP